MTIIYHKALNYHKLRETILAVVDSRFQILILNWKKKSRFIIMIILIKITKTTWNHSKEVRHQKRIYKISHVLIWTSNLHKITRYSSTLTETEGQVYLKMSKEGITMRLLKLIDHNSIVYQIRKIRKHLDLLSLK